MIGRTLSYFLILCYNRNSRQDLLKWFLTNGTKNCACQLHFIVNFMIFVLYKLVREMTDFSLTICSLRIVTQWLSSSHLIYCKELCLILIFWHLKLSVRSSSKRKPNTLMVNRYNNDTVDTQEAWLFPTLSNLASKFKFRRWFIPTLTI